MVCDKTIGVLDTKTRQVFPPDKNYDQAKRAGDKKPKRPKPLFSADDRKLKKVKDKDGIETSVEEAMTITCSCGRLNMVY
jgi:hypothetical protein